MPSASTIPSRVQAEQIRVLYRGAPVAVLSAWATAAMLCLVLRGPGGPPDWLLFGWLSYPLLACVAGHLALCGWFAVQERADAAWRVWARRFVALALLEGITWGAGAVWMTSTDLGNRQFFTLTMLLGGVTIGAVPAYGSYLPALYAFVMPTLLPYGVYETLLGNPLERAMGPPIVVLLVFVVFLARNSFNAVVVRSLHDRFENVDLVDALRIETARSEQASLDKSRFLAASSHDLRQPVHALGMFVAALRARDMDTEARRLIVHIEDCLAGLKELFDALLDISRLDAGAIEPRPIVFPLRPLLERMSNDYTPVAAAKSLSLRLVPCSASVRTDPVLLERVLRNLVDNAARHTEHGRILIGCRRAGPGLLRIEVHDTGPGIPETEQERVFQEFVQLGNPERDHTKGIGLGLAIVRRLARLLECGLVLRSAPGRGTMFALTVPNAPAGERALAVAPRAAISALRGTVLVVDDELAVLAGMRSLLSSWGLDVLTAESGEEMLALTADRHETPALLICDWRLRGTEDGIAVIDALRARFGTAIPALLITGDVAPDQRFETRRGDFPMLHKPVPPGRLRAMIGGMIGVASSTLP